MLVMHQMRKSPGSFKTLGHLNWSSAQPLGVGSKTFFKKQFYSFITTRANMWYQEVTPPISRVINTQIFLLLSQISQLLLNQSLCPAFHISCAACKIIPKFPFTALGLLCALDQYERVSGGSKRHEKFKTGSGIWEEIPVCLLQIILANLLCFHM